jgi:hypothetical protein
MTGSRRGVITSEIILRHVEYFWQKSCASCDFAPFAGFGGLCYNSPLDNFPVPTGLNSLMLMSNPRMKEHAMNDLPRRRTVAAFAAVTLLLAGLATPARAQGVLDQVPSDALVVLKVKNLNATSGKIGKMLTDFGVAAMVPGTDNPLAFVQKQLNLQNGIRTDGELAFVYRDPEVTREDDEKSMMVLIPITDYKTFLSNFTDLKADGDVTEFQFVRGERKAAAPAGTGGPAPGADDDDDKTTGSGHKGYAAQWGNFAAISPAKLPVGTKPAAMLKVSGAATTKELAAKDIILMANFQALRPKLLPQLQSGRDEMLAEVEQGVARDEKMAKYAPVIKTFVGQFISIAEAFLRDADAATFGVNFGAEGLSTTVLAEFQTDSYVGKLASSIKNSSEPMLVGLPSGKYLLYGGAINNPGVGDQIVDDFTGPILREVNALGPEMKPIGDYVTALKDYMRANKSSTFGLVAPQGNLGTEAIIQFVSVNKGDATAMRTAQQRMMTSQEEAMKAFGMPADAMKVSVTPNAKTIGGVSFDQVSTTMNTNTNDPVARQQQQIISMMYGPEGMNMLLGQVDPNTLLMVSGVTEQVTTGAIAAAKANDAPLSKLAQVQSVAANLPKQRTMELYIPVDQIAATGMTYAKAFMGGAPEFRLPEDLPPIGMTMGVDGTAFKGDAYVPTSLVQAIVSASMQVMMQMQGGGQPGGRGGL